VADSVLAALGTAAYRFEVGNLADVTADTRERLREVLEDAVRPHANLIRVEVADVGLGARVVYRVDGEVQVTVLEWAELPASHDLVFGVTDG